MTTLSPGSPQHEVATKVLLLMRDGLHLLVEINKLVAESGQPEAKAAK